jgi:putative SOS response-associated peptidase YedK
MCGRYASFLPTEFIAHLFVTVNPLPKLALTWNMAPTMEAPVVRLIDGERHLDALKWGLVPYFTKDLKKARPRCRQVLGSSFPSALARPARMSSRRRWVGGRPS